MEKTYRNLEHKALDAASKGWLCREFLPVFGTDNLRSWLSKEYVYVSDDQRVLLGLYGARALLDYEGLWNDGRLLGK